MVTILDKYPVVDEFGPGSTTCADGGFRGTGCTVCTTATILLRWGKPIPRTSSGAPDMVSLGRSMGNRHRSIDPHIRHGLSLIRGQGCTGGYWCAFCAYLELKARGVPVGYGPLSLGQLRAHADAGHPMVVPGDYWKVPIVGPFSFDSKTPARGRVQVHLSTRPFGHMVAVWQSLRSATEGRYAYVISDPDFGSYDGARIPAHSIWSDHVLEAFWEGFGGGLPITYALTVPPPVGQQKPPPAGVVFKYGGRATSRGAYSVPKGVNIRRDPHVKTGNVYMQTPRSMSFAAAQATYAGTNVNGSTLWLGTKDGNCWVLKNLTKLIGHTSGKEDLR